MLRNIILVAARNFLRYPGPSILNVVGLAIGFTCMFLTLLWMTNEFSFDRFHKEPETIYKVITHVETDGSFQTFDAASASIDISSVPEIEQVVTISEGTRWPNELCFRPEGKADECIYLNGIFATPSFFSVFNYPVVKGDRDPLRQASSLAVSESMAARLFGESDPVGKTISIDDHFPVVVTAVFRDVPPNSSLKFDFVMAFPVFARMRGLDPSHFAGQFFSTFVKTREEIDPKDLTSRLNDSRVLTDRLKADNLSYEAFPFTKWRLHSKFQDGKNAGGRITYVVIFIVIGILVLFLAVINFVNLSTARATVRAREIGIRKVTGAFRINIIAQFLGESFVIVFLAFVLAALLTQLSLPYFTFLLTEQIATTLTTGFIPLYLGLFLVAVALLAGIYPAFVMSSFQPIRVLKGHVKGQGSNRLRKALLVVQLSVSIAILIFSGILYLQLDFIVNKDLGFDRNNIIRIEPTYQMLQKFQVFRDQALKDPNIISASTAAGNPLDVQAQNTGVWWPGKPDNLRVTFQTFGCSYEFTGTFGLKLVDGRLFTDHAADSVNTEVIVTEQAAFVMGLKELVGTVIKIGDANCVIVGVIQDFHTQPLHRERLPVILFRSDYTSTYSVFVRYQPGKAREAMEVIASAYKTVEPKFTMKYWFLDETFDKQYKTEKVASQLVLVFSLIALAIAIIGVVGLATFNVMRRLREMSIRKIFGASALQILKLLMSEFAVIILAAVIISIPVVWYAAGEWLNNFAYHIAMPWWIYAVCCTGAALVTIAIITALGLKAVAGNPTEILRNE